MFTNGLKNIALSACVAATLTALQPGVAMARDPIQIVGSSTVYPVSSSVGERLGIRGTGKTPVVGSTGPGGGG